MAEAKNTNKNKKIKNLVNHIKVTYLDNDDNNEQQQQQNQNPNQQCNYYYTSLLQLELLQRGVVVDNANDDNNNNKMIKIIGTVRDAVGKPLLEVSIPNILPPSQLMAASNVVQGRIAEKIGELLTVSSQATASETASSSTSSTTITSSIQDALNRCDDVGGDERFRIILNSFLLTLTYLMNTTDDDINNDKNKTATSSNSNIIQQQQLLLVLLTIAEGCYLRAATFQPDTPMLYKRALDVTMERKRLQQQIGDNNIDNNNNNIIIYYTRDATYVLDQMIRIASSKQNTKRINELLLQKAACIVLDSDSSTSFDNGNNKTEKKEVQEKEVVVAEKAFVLPYRKSTKTTDALQLVEMASDCLSMLPPLQSSSTTTESEENKLLLLRSIVEFKVRQLQFSSNDDSKGDDIDNEQQLLSNAIDLRDRVLFLRCNSHSQQPKPKLSQLSSVACTLLQTYIVHMKNRAISVSKRMKTMEQQQVDDDVSVQCWKSCTNFVVPIILKNSVSVSKSDDDRDDEGRHNISTSLLIETACYTIVTCEWWYTSVMSSRTLITPISVLMVVRNTLRTLYRNLVEKNAADAKRRNEVVCGMNNNDDDMLVQQQQQQQQTSLYCAYRSVRSMLYLYGEIATGGAGTAAATAAATTTTITQLQKEIVNDALTALSQHHKHHPDSTTAATTAADSEFGTSYFEFLICWSGLHNTPWQSPVVALMSSITTTTTSTMSDLQFIVSNARECVTNATKSIGRRRMQQQQDCSMLLLDLAQADCCCVTGNNGSSRTSSGVINDSRNLYRKVLDSIDKQQTTSIPMKIIQSRCYSGLVHIALLRTITDKKKKDDEPISHLLPSIAEADGTTISTPEDLAMYNLKFLQDIIADIGAEKEEGTITTPLPTGSSGLYCLWKKSVADDGGGEDTTRTAAAITIALRYHLNAVRQQVADSLLRKGRIQQARVFLQDAVQAAPNDPKAAFSLGAFMLRILLFHQGTTDDDEGDGESITKRTTQIQLLKAAKLDSTKASPFALLGIWYEYYKDIKRSIGCYSKALIVDPCHPVAGRGILRLVKDHVPVMKILKKATDVAAASSLNGWAWRALGSYNAMVEGKDDLAVVSYLEALRCRDIQNPKSDMLSVFYGDPFSSSSNVGNNSENDNSSEYVNTLADLAACYRRLGRFTASVRSYHTAIEEAGGEDVVDNTILCSCAQVEMELGLFDEASEKLSRAVITSEKEGDDTKNNQIKTVSSYGLGVCLLSMAKRDCQDGKAGAALGYLRKGIEYCKQITTGRYACVMKLIGDIHTFGAMLPPDVFYDQSSSMIDDESSASSRGESLVRAQLAFMEEGIDAYRATEDCVVGSDDDETVALRACTATDLGSNLLLQGQILSFAQSKGLLDLCSSPESDDLYKRAGSEFQRALQLCPVYAPAWCGLGCSVAHSDPLLAQHAFCRSITFDNLFPDPYANLGFLYTANNLLDRSGSVSDALTQIADTPMMWINRALVLERQGTTDETVLSAGNSFLQAADAYRAALQVAPLPVAKNGLAMTCRIGVVRDENESCNKNGQQERDESDCLLSEYLSSTGQVDVPSRIFGGISKIEGGATTLSSESKSMIDEGSSQAAEALEVLYGLSLDGASSLDIEPIQTCVVLAKEAEKATTQAQTVEEQKHVNLARQVLYEPNRGDLWLALAKELVRQAHSSSNDGSSSMSALQDACTASRKARDILLQKVKGQNFASASSTTISSSANMVQARDVSDALSLNHFLERITTTSTNDDQLQQHGDGSNGDSGQEQKEEVMNSSTSVVDVQRALILCPDNALAREIAFSC